MKFLLCIVSCVFVSGSGIAQEKSDSLRLDSSRSAITILTEADGARVFLDSVNAGVTPLTVSLAKGVHRIKIVPPDIENWLTESITDSIVVTGAAAETLRFAFVRRVMVLTNPSGASVMVNDSLLGTTPLALKPGSGSTFKIVKGGYEPAVVHLAEAKHGVISSHLKKIWGNESEESLQDAPVEKSSSLRLYVAGAAAIIAGAASAYLKVKADNSYSQYVNTGEPNALSDTNRFDTAAAISLAVTQISLGLFTYFILSE